MQVLIMCPQILWGCLHAKVGRMSCSLVLFYRAAILCIIEHRNVHISKERCHTIQFLLPHYLCVATTFFSIQGISRSAAYDQGYHANFDSWLGRCFCGRMNHDTSCFSFWKANFGQLLRAWRKWRGLLSLSPLKEIFYFLSPFGLRDCCKSGKLGPEQDHEVKIAFQ